ncbi:polysaccharide deacetylase family protein [uncultured Imperialibacter sp.]|uniref:polysaccharide deacetylase family protein n=1 Tax=uncultured Imperialibacter sp. TaxID=1672639 RepID=UPI0030DC325F
MLSIRLLWWVVLLLTTANSTLLGQMNREVVGFVYHRVGDSRYPSTNISTESFDAHLNYLKQNNFKVLTISEAVDYLKKPGERERVAVITIDDGYESFYKNGLPLLKKYGFPATVFINTETVGGSSYMDWNQLSDCLANKIEIGNHSHSHAYFLNEAPPARNETFRSDVEKAQALIKERLGITAKAFAYPYGEFDPKMAALLQEMGFSAGLAQNSGVMHGGSNLFSLPRFPMASGFSPLEKFISKANMRALKVTTEKPESFLMTANDPSPTLQVTFAQSNLMESQLQCFVQGGSCVLEKKKSGDKIEVTVKPGSALRSRRTLYTLTIKDTDGHWHWFSHLWVNPALK